MKRHSGGVAGNVPPMIISSILSTWLRKRTVRLSAQLRRAATGIEGMAGKTGSADTDLDLEGWVTVQGERWHARAEEKITRGERIEVVSGSGLELRVRKGA